jgi:flavorubredoxin
MSNETSYNDPVSVAEGIHWIGFEDKSAGFRCNPYLMVDKGQAILFEPGSIPHFPQVLSKLCKLVPFESITHIIVSHQDPDLCAAIPRFEELIYGTGGACQIVTHSRASVLIAHYGVKSSFYHVDANDWKLTLNSGRELKFVFTPYMHFPGAFMTFDAKSGVLFSGDVFGAFSFDWTLKAGGHYIEAMRAFHENYMPSREIVASAMTKLEKLDIRIIAPQHGSVIDRNPREYIAALKNLDCGDYVYGTGD